LAFLNSAQSLTVGLNFTCLKKKKKKQKNKIQEHLYIYSFVHTFIATNLLFRSFQSLLYLLLQHLCSFWTFILALVPYISLSLGFGLINLTNICQYHLCPQFTFLSRSVALHSCSLGLCCPLNLLSHKLSMSITIQDPIHAAHPPSYIFGSFPHLTVLLSDL
jgi:hypothetical protein